MKFTTDFTIELYHRQLLIQQRGMQLFEMEGRTCNPWVCLVQREEKKGGKECAAEGFMGCIHNSRVCLIQQGEERGGKESVAEGFMLC